MAENQSGRQPQPESSTKSTEGSFSVDERKQFTLALMQVCQLQQEYGKKGEDFEMMVKGFLWILADYPMAVVLMAMKKWIKSNPTIPTPSDLVKIIDPPPEPLSAAVYVDIKKRMREVNQYIPDYEKKYCRDFEAQEMAKTRGGSEQLRDAQRQLENHSKAWDDYD